MAIPKCPYFKVCGGCASQNVDYKDQLENKKKLMQSATRFDDVKVFSGKEYGYRNRMDFIFHNGGLGFREEKWYKIVDIESCVISDDRINFLLQEVRDFFKGADAFDINKKTGTYKYAVIRVSSISDAISFVLNEDSTKTAAVIEKIKSFAEKSSAKNILVSYVGKDNELSISNNFFVVKGEEELEEIYLGRKFRYSIQGFFQNNHAMANQMQEYIHVLLEQYETKDSHLLDLYGGVGTFGIINADLFKEVTTVESFSASTDAANKNIELNNLKNIKAVCLDAKQIKKLELPKDLFVITDPPRSGMHLDTIQNLIERKPKVIIYISCNIMQLSKDLPKFKDYEIRSAAVFDLFPQTNHAEGVVELVLKK